MSRASATIRQLSVLILLLLSSNAQTIQSASTTGMRVARFVSASSIEVVLGGHPVSLSVGEHSGPWTLQAVINDPAGAGRQVAVLEDFEHRNGHMLFVDSEGVQVDLPKTSEETSADPATLYHGHKLDEITSSASDLLAEEILAKPGDPTYDEVAGVFPPIRDMASYSFLGAPDTFDKVGFAYGGRTPDFDPAPYYAAIAKIRDEGKVLDGLLGGYLPVLRFVYPESDNNWTEMIAFAPPRIANNNDRIQPVWYRISRVEQGSLKWAKYIDSYHPFPPRADYDPKLFYQDLVSLRADWGRLLQPAMKVELPDERMANIARFGLVREMMTRIHDFPKYGAVDKNYGGSEHDGFPDTFTVDTAAMLDWGLIDVAGRYIDNYFGKFVRDDGSILYRGPETGQYGRMLTIAAQYVNFGGDPKLLLKHRSRIDGITHLLLRLREKARKLSPKDPAYGMIAGWSEADASLDADPPRYMQPYFSNSTEAARGFRDLGRVWQNIGKQTGDAGLAKWGEDLQRDAQELEKDIQTAISRSILRSEEQAVLPAIAGVKEPFHIVVPRDPTDPQFRSYRAYMEMLYSGLLTDEQVKMVVDYRNHHHDVILGIPTAYGYNTGEVAGFLSYGHGYGLIQHDMIREALLLTYSLMAHQNTRGTWTAPETRSILPGKSAAPYCTPAQLAVSLMTRWMLVFEDPQSDTLWLGKAIPRQWLQDGKITKVENAPTRYGRVGLSIASHANSRVIEVDLKLPASLTATTKVRLRHPDSAKLKAVTLNGKPWTDFSAKDETITIPAGVSGDVKLVAMY